MIPFFDSHAHLADPAFDPDRDEVLGRLREAGGVGVVCIGESPDAATKAAEIAARYPGFVWFTAGLHPHTASAFDPARDPDSIRQAVANGAVAIGECGLDYHYDHSPRALQRRAFTEQLQLAAELKRPVVVHTRDADDDTASIVREAGGAGITGVLHCFTGGSALAAAAIEAGWHISYSGIVTFAKWSGADIFRSLPQDRLLVESDAPYLAPVPSRGKRNEPVLVTNTIVALAGARGVSVEHMSLVTTQNASRFFGVALTNAS